MWMSRRATEREYMDDQRPPQAVVDEVYTFLGAINRWLGGAKATLARLESFSQQWRPDERIRVLDVACGGGDLAQDIVSWGRRRNFDVRATGLDISLSALTSARRLGRSDARLTYLCGDVHHSPCRDRSFDYVSCSLYFHHLTDDEVISTLRTFERLATRGIIVNDLVRRRRHYVWSWILTRPFNVVLRNDGPLSVRRAFRPQELAALVERSGLRWLSIQRHFGHRMTLAGERGSRAEDSDIANRAGSSPARAYRPPPTGDVDDGT